MTGSIAYNIYIKNFDNTGVCGSVIEEKILKYKL